MMRIRHPSIVDKKAPVVFLQHGIMQSANCWVMNYAEKSPAFIFAKAGYDVWLGNNRGNKYSRGHVRLDPLNKADKKEYFSYSF
jgi:pimeloyl-ACP methyl ester carboxylesterase